MHITDRATATGGLIVACSVDAFPLRGQWYSKAPAGHTKEFKKKTNPWGSIFHSDRKANQRSESG